MLLGQVGIVSCFIILALLLLFLNLYSHWNWRVKSSAILIVMLFYIVSYFSIPPLLGWPTKQQVPERFKLISEIVLEPDKAKGTSGDIYIWITDLEEDPAIAKPRAYRIPYSPEMHEIVIEAGNKVRKGLPQIGEVSEDGGDFTSTIDPSDAYQGGDVSTAIEFFDLPEPVLPDK